MTQFNTVCEHTVCTRNIWWCILPHHVHYFCCLLLACCNQLLRVTIITLYHILKIDIYIIYIYIHVYITASFILGLVLQTNCNTGKLCLYGDLGLTHNTVEKQKRRVETKVRTAKLHFTERCFMPKYFPILCAISAGFVVVDFFFIHFLPCHSHFILLKSNQVVLTVLLNETLLFFYLSHSLGLVTIRGVKYPSH